MPAGIDLTPRTSLSMSTTATSGVTNRMRRTVCVFFLGALVKGGQYLAVTLFERGRAGRERTVERQGQHYRQRQAHSPRHDLPLAESP
jgi:hypothetical protein